MSVLSTSEEPSSSQLVVAFFTMLFLNLYYVSIVVVSCCGDSGCGNANQ